MRAAVRRTLGNSWIRAAALAPLALAAMGGTPGHATPITGFLHWSSTPIDARQPAQCFAIAKDLMTKDAFTHVEQRPSEVVGNYQGTYVTITCIATRPKVTAVVMVVGLSDSKTTTVRDMLTTQLGATPPAGSRSR